MYFLLYVARGEILFFKMESDKLMVICLIIVISILFDSMLPESLNERNHQATLHNNRKLAE
jgi:hypothetical protein